jgi:tRNA A37 methylthiotransferase MiaB
VFPYSPRPGTAAEALGDLVTAGTKAERSARLRDLSDRAGLAHRRARIGSGDRVLVERRLEDGARTGLGADYTRFALPPGHAGPGAMVDVVAAAAAGDHLVGRPVGP